MRLGIAIVLLTIGFSRPTWANELVRAQGEFTAEIDISSLALTLAPCSDEAVLPPGGYEGFFTSALEFAGKVDGRSLGADLTYRWRIEPGGAIDALLISSNALKGRLFGDPIVATGGSYSGFPRVASQ